MADTPQTTSKPRLAVYKFSSCDGCQLSLLNLEDRLLTLVGAVEEVLVEGCNQALGQWIGRTSQNRVLNFTHAGSNGDSLVGTYVPVRVTRSGPNSLAGESV